jgi:hypothetical protein
MRRSICIISYSGTLHWHNRFKVSHYSNHDTIQRDTSGTIASQCPTFQTNCQANALHKMYHMEQSILSVHVCMHPAGFTQCCVPSCCGGSKRAWPLNCHKRWASAVHCCTIRAMPRSSNAVLHAAASHMHVPLLRCAATLYQQHRFCLHRPHRTART